MPVTFVSSTTPTELASIVSSASVDRPTALDGDLVLMHVMHRADGATPAGQGWTRVAEISYSTPETPSQTTVIFAKEATAIEPSTYTVNFDGTSARTGIGIMVFRYAALAGSSTMTETTALSNAWSIHRGANVTFSGGAITDGVEATFAADIIGNSSITTSWQDPSGTLVYGSSSAGRRMGGSYRAVTSATSPYAPGSALQHDLGNAQNSHSYGAVTVLLRYVAPASALVVDSFDRANNTSTVGSPQTGPAPAVVMGTWGINSNRLYASAVSGGAALLTYDLGTQNLDIQIDLVSSSNPRGVGVSDGVNAWVLMSSDTQYYYSMVRTNGSGTIIGVTTFELYSNGVGIPLGSTKRVRLRNGVLQLMVNGAVLLTRKLEQPPSPLATRAALYVTSTAHRLDNLLIRPMSSDIPVQDTLTSRLYKGRDTRALDAAEVA